ncbi:hypothetical protein [Streptosporangium sp. NPDC020145]|uniref:hypothetical protein n=1 Tax=Streptosporangium sp. NPDC020145 TaxID=3154694 RepID=UPI003436CF85
MKNRSGNDQDRLVHGGAGETAGVPSQRAEEVTSVFRTPEGLPGTDGRPLTGDTPDPAHPADLSPEAGHPASEAPRTRAEGAPREGALLDQDPDEVRRRWQEVQAGFVDDPRDSVERADSLVAEVGDRLRAALEARSAGLRERWKNAEGARGSDTEDLRTALRDYRALLDRLLDMSSAGSPEGLPAGRR